MAGQPIVHVEFASSDPAAAAQFFGNLFGWQSQRDPDVDYHMFQAEGGPGGGFVKADGVQYRTGETLAYVHVDDIDETLRQAGALGATVVTPRTEIPGMGWYAILTEPSGARIGLFMVMQAQP